MERDIPIIEHLVFCERWKEANLIAVNRAWKHNEILFISDMAMADEERIENGYRRDRILLPDAQWGAHCSLL